MALVPLSPPGSAAELALSSIEKLSRRRQAAAQAHAHAQAIQVKCALAICLTFTGVAGYGLHRMSASHESEKAVAAAAAQAQADRDAAARTNVGQILMPFQGSLCREYRFDNKTGAVIGEGVAPCATAENGQQPNADPSRNMRAQAILKAFKY